MASSIHALAPHGNSSAAETSAMNGILGRRPTHTPSSSMLAPPVPSSRGPRRLTTPASSLAAQSLAQNAQATTPSRTLYKYSLAEPEAFRRANAHSPISDDTGDDSLSGDSSANISHNTFQSLEREVAPQVAAASSSYRAPSVARSTGPRKSLNGNRPRHSRASAFDDAAYRPASDSSSSDEGRARSVSSRRGPRASQIPNDSVPPPGLDEDGYRPSTSARPQATAELRNRKTTAPKSPQLEPAQPETDIAEDYDGVDISAADPTPVRITGYGARGTGTPRVVQPSPAQSKMARGSVAREPRSRVQTSPLRRAAKANAVSVSLQDLLAKCQQPGVLWSLFFFVMAICLCVICLKGGVKSWGDITTPQQPTPIPIPGDVSQLAAKLASLEQAIVKLESQPPSAPGTPPNLEASIQKSSTVQTLRRELDALRSEMASVKTVVRDHDVKFKNYAVVEQEVIALKTRVTAVEQDVKAALDDGRLRSALENLLPSMMPVRVDERGVYSIDPSFWAHLKKVFVVHDDVDKRFRTVDERLRTAEQARDKKAGAVQPSTPWKLADHEAELQSWAADMFRRKAASEQLITKSEFISLIEDHLSSLRQELKALRNHVPKSGSTTIVTSKGEDITPALQGIVDASLLKFSKDTIARADYALYSGGARVIDELTTQLLLVEEPGLWSRRIKGSQPIYGLPPETALTDAVQTGSCWPFKGGEGQLGVGLPRDIVVSSVTLQHLPKEQSYGDIASAPRRVEVYAKVSGEENQRKAAYLAEKWDGQSTLQPTDETVLLTSFTYDWAAPAHIQTFPIPPHIVELGIDTRIVLFRFVSNWGGDTTCVYRVRVHGEPVPTA